MSYKRPYCPDCKLIWGENAISRVAQCSKCGVTLILEDFNPYTKSILGLLIIAAGCLTFFIKEFPILWIGGFLWGISIIANAFQNWVRIKRLDENARNEKFHFPLQFIKTFINRHKFAIIKCLNCEQKLRVPKIRKKLRITCPKCKNSFIITPAPFIQRILSLYKPIKNNS